MLDRVISHVYRLEARFVNFYLCEEEDGLTLIDTGMPKHQETLWTTLAEIGYQATDIKHILITHADIDHAGNLSAIQAATGAKVYAGKETAVFLQTGTSPNHMPWPIQFFLDHFMHYESISPNVIEPIQEGDILPIMGSLQVLATPGHTLDHHSFYSPTHGVLFAGDALNTRDGRIQASPNRITADKEAARQSAIRLLQLAPATIACGHGIPSKNHSSDDLMTLFNQLRQNEV